MSFWFSVFYVLSCNCCGPCFLPSAHIRSWNWCLDWILLSWSRGGNKKKIIGSLPTVSDLRHRPPLKKIFFMGTWSSEVINFHGCMSQQVDKKWFIRSLTGWFIFVMCSYKSYFLFFVPSDCWSYFIYSYLILIFMWFFPQYYFCVMSKWWLVYSIFELLQ